MKNKKTISGITLIELLVAISVSGIITFTITMMFQSAFSAYDFSQKELIVYKALSSALDEVINGTFDSYAVKDSLEIVEATARSITFVPLWVEEGRYTLVKDSAYYLDIPHKSGASTPIVEIKKKGEQYYRPTEITFFPRPDAKKKDSFKINTEFPPGLNMRVSYYPDAVDFPQTQVKIFWDKKNKNCLYTYKNKTKILPMRFLGAGIKDAVFEYFDNANVRIMPEGSGAGIPAEKLGLITAARLTLTGDYKGEERQMSSFISIRNSRAHGLGVIIQQGTHFKMPDSRNVRTFSLVNISGAKSGDIIRLEARPKSGQAYAVEVELAGKEETIYFKNYSIEYPPGHKVYSEHIDQSVDLGLNILTVGRTGVFDYDFDGGIGNEIELKGDVELFVPRMDCTAAAVFIRP